MLELALVVISSCLSFSPSVRLYGLGYALFFAVHGTMLAMKVWLSGELLCAILCMTATSVVFIRKAVYIYLHVYIYI